MTMVERCRHFLHRLVKVFTPSPLAWRGASRGIMGLVILLVGAYFATYFVQDFAWQKLPAFLAIIGLLAGFGLLLLVAVPMLGRIPVIYRVALFLFVPFLALFVAPGNDGQAAAFTAATIFLVSLLGAGVAVLSHEGLHPFRQKVTLAALAIGVVGFIGGLYAIFSNIESPHPLLDEYVLDDQTLALSDPGLPGDFQVRTLTYGSGKDLRRADYRENVGIIARSVDGSKLIDNWDGLPGWLRTSYWGFDASELPLQARVWYPDGVGPFPLVLIVHGNHSMEDYSDPGYGYLGELFASRGIILASVDENFLNSSISAAVEVFADRPGLKEENDARGWLLLEHLRQWRDWNIEPGHRFRGQVDIDRVALIGHSRGGEAVAVAAAFNTLDRYPDDASVAFDFGFNLRGIVAIAPVDGQYRPRDNGTPINDVNYFTIHGSMDGDVQSFDGTAQYSRVSLPSDDFRFRSSLYVTGANHGQFNTTWGNLDTSLFRAWALDTGRIMEGEEQRRVARVFFSAFMEVVLRDRHEYLAVFSDVRKAAKWIPSTYYISQFSSSRDVVIADFEEDIDPSTMTINGGRIETQHLSRWYETANALKYARRISKHETHAAVYAWDKAYSAETARVSFILPTSTAVPATQAVVSASISAAGIATLPDDWETPTGENGDAVVANEEDDEPAPLDWTVVLSDAAGNSASLPLSHDEMLYPQVKAVPRRASFLDGTEASEVLFRRFEFPLADFIGNAPALDIQSLTRLEFVFDRSPKGAIIIDDLSFGQHNDTDQLQ